MNTSNNPLKFMRDTLRESYRHRKHDDWACVLCGTRDRPMAFHVIEKSVKQTESIPDGFVPMAMSMGYIKGSFPVCEKCSPPCSKCQLPICTPIVNKYIDSTQAKLGVGYCKEHMHWRYVLSALTSKFFK